MTIRRTDLDPTDYSAGMAAGANVMEVVSINDPNKSGRVLVRPCGQMEDFDDSSQMQWIPLSHMMSPNHGWGLSGLPPGLEVGSKVMCQSVGQQNWVVTSVLPNTRDPSKDNKADQHKEVSEEKSTPHSRLPGGQGQTGDRAQGQSIVASPATDHRGNDGKNLNPKQVRDWIQRAIVKYGEDTFLKRVKIGPAPKKYYNRSKIRNEENQIGAFPFDKGDLKKVENFMRQFNIPFAIPQTPSILDSLTQVGKSGGLFKAEDAVGGMSNILGAIQFAQNFLSNIQKQNKQNQKDPLLEWLYELYRQLFKKEPLDENGKETEEYKIWKAQYLAGLENGETS